MIRHAVEGRGLLNSSRPSTTTRLLRIRVFAQDACASFTCFVRLASCYLHLLSAFLPIFNPKFFVHALQTGSNPPLHTLVLAVGHGKSIEKVREQIG
jgi:hypothetical protein